MKHVIEFVEKGRNCWEGKTWYRAYNHLMEALEAIELEHVIYGCTPEYYIVANYLGEMLEQDIPDDVEQ